VVDEEELSDDFVELVFSELVEDSVFAPEVSLPPELSPDSLFFFVSPLFAELLPLLA
jgi:hypothetical protein